ncbi:MAG: hybrid sensor histidine kinase/response regulator [Cytophagales bacterium]|nr:MAG: hybrid sensor histidine kinase/response regulator [Cytophagales bacterium]
MRSEKYNILYVDDEKSNLNVFNATFRRDYNVFTANSAAEGIELLASSKIDIIITDQRMPKMTGAEFLKWSKVHYPETIRIILTGFSDTEAIITAINECDIYRYIAKPWDGDEMKLTLKKASEVQQLRQDNQKLIADLKEAKESLEQKVIARTTEVMEQKEEIEKKSKALEEQNYLLQEIDSEKNNIISMIVHDLQSPINRIKGLIELFTMENRTPFSENQILYLDLIRRNISDASRHIRNLLDTKVLEGNIDYQVPLKKTSLSKILPMMLDSYREQYMKKKVNLHYHHENNSEEIYVNGNEDYINRIFDNLISNALKFSPKDNNSNVFVKIKKNGTNINVIVQDEGQGLTGDDKKNLFKKFQKLSAVPTNGESSSGLGLSIVKTLTEKLGGNVWAEDNQAKGATFVVEFPQYTDA